MAPTKLPILFECLFDLKYSRSHIKFIYQWKIRSDPVIRLYFDKAGNYVVPNAMSLEQKLLHPCTFIRTGVTVVQMGSYLSKERSLRIAAKVQSVH